MVDPCCASDAFLRTGAEARTHQDAAFAAFRAAGFDPDAVDVVVMSHLDGIGMNALVDDDGRWHPAFAHAPIVLSDVEWDKTRRPRRRSPTPLRSWTCTRRAPSRRCRSPTGSPPRSRWSPPAGTVPATRRWSSARAATRALFLGHLAVSPMQAAIERPVVLHDDPELGGRALAHWLADAATDDALVIGPLWPAPGAAHVQLDPVVLVPAG